MSRAPTKAEKAVAQDEAEVRSLATGEVLRERGLWKSAKREKPTPLTTVSGRGVWAIHVGSTGASQSSVSFASTHGPTSRPSGPPLLLTLRSAPHEHVLMMHTPPCAIGLYRAPGMGAV